MLAKEYAAVPKGTYEEFETGPWHGTSAQPKQSWGGIPDIWFTSEVLVGLRHFLGLAACLPSR